MIPATYHPDTNTVSMEVRLGELRCVSTISHAAFVARVIAFPGLYGQLVYEGTRVGEA